MAFKINKGGNLGKYYYLLEGVEYGPVEVSELLERITKDTLVYFEGIPWTKAGGIPELRRYFLTEEKVVEKVVERVVEQKVVEAPAPKKSILVPLLLLLILAGGGFWYFEQKQRAERDAFERLQQAEADSISSATAAQLAMEQQRIQDSLLMASSAILDSAKLIKLGLDYQVGVEKVKLIISGFLKDLTSQNAYLRPYFADTVQVFFSNTQIPVSDLERGLAESFMRNSDYTEEFQFMDSTCVYSSMDGMLGVYTFNLLYKQLSTANQSLRRFDEVVASVKVNSDFKIVYYNWVSSQPANPDLLNN